MESASRAEGMISCSAAAFVVFLVNVMLILFTEILNVFKLWGSAYESIPLPIVDTLSPSRKFSALLHCLQDLHLVV